MEYNLVANKIENLRFKPTHFPFPLHYNSEFLIYCKYLFIITEA